MSRTKIYIYTKRRYTAVHFLFDLFMIAVTGGLWLIWMIIR